MVNNKPNCLVICGPTASGKTSLALSVARLLPQANILSADSRQIYKGLDIITGKDIPLDIPKKISFHGLNLIEPNQAYDLNQYANYAHKVMTNSLEQKMPLIIVGGTGLYIKTLTSNYFNVRTPPNHELRKQLEAESLLRLQEILSKLNHSRYLALNHSDLHNPRRLIRAIEISIFLDGSQTQQSQSFITNYQFHVIGILKDKATLTHKIRQRVIERISAGAYQEVLDLQTKFPELNLPIYSSLGVKQLLQYGDRLGSRDKLIESWTKAEVDYSRRQMVWFKKQKDIVWYDKDINPQILANIITGNS